ncbi:MAG: caspase family protein [Terriglobia bacterium]
MSKNYGKLLWLIAFLVGCGSAQPQTDASQRGVAPVDAQAETPSPQQHGPYYALVIGIKDYHNMPKLQTPLFDADAVAKTLLKDYGFEVNELKNATRHDILAALDQYRRTLPENASLLIYYAGHGVYDKDTDKGYWLPVDAEKDTNADWISADDITSDARAIPARHILIISDSCYSGTLTRGGSFAVTPREHSRYVEKMLMGKSRYLMASGGNEPVADEGAPHHSVFADFLLQGLTGIEEDEFSGEEFFNRYIKQQVAGRSKQVPVYNLIRDSGHVNGDFVFFRRVAGKRAESPDATWSFAVSGDSRNCGDVVMPAIAAHALKRRPAFYWHLGDLRATYTFDEDMLHEPEHAAHPMTINDYLGAEWDDFVQNQIRPFGALPFYLGIGNHETIPPKTRDQFIIKFAPWLDAPVLHQQRLSDDGNDDHVRAYYHWIERQVDFINLDNATSDQFDSAQLAWFESVLNRDEADPMLRTIVVGVHRALPESISRGHSMNESPAGTESGRRVYADLLKAQDEAHKHVYVLASHSHYFMDGIYNTKYWQTNGGVLPGWIVGTAGAVRYALPEGSYQAKLAMTNVYGYLLATVTSCGEIVFDFQEIKQRDVPSAVVDRFKPDFVEWCFDKNTHFVLEDPLAP